MAMTETTIRPATHEDIDSLLPLSRAFHHAARLHEYAAWDPEKWRYWLTRCIDAERGLCLVATNGTNLPVGFTTAVAVPAYWDQDVIACQETVLWVVPEHRGHGVGTSLIESMIAWGKEKGCAVASVGTQQHMAPKKTAYRYRKLGFELTEKAFARRL